MSLHDRPSHSLRQPNIDRDKKVLKLGLRFLKGRKKEKEESLMPT